MKALVYPVVGQTFDGDVWSVTPDHIDLRLSTPYIPSALSGFERRPIVISVPAPSLPRHQSSSWNLSELASEFHSEYHCLEEIMEFVNELSETYPCLVEVIRIGHSSEGREIIGIKIEVVWRLPLDDLV
jgi:extracellular matrix protein 14